MLSKDEAFRLSRYCYADIKEAAQELRDTYFRSAITYLPNVTIPITHAHTSSCLYCTNVDKDLPEEHNKAHLSIEDVTRLCSLAVANNVSDVHICLDEDDDIRNPHHFLWLQEFGYKDIIDYFAQIARIVLIDMELLPSISAGAISDKQIRQLKEVSISQGLSLDSIAGRLWESDGIYFGQDWKSPARRLATIEAAGRAKVPLNIDLYVGLNDTRHERIEGLMALRELNHRYEHIQSISIKYHTDTKFSTEFIEEFLWTISATRMIVKDTIHVQSQPNHFVDIKELLFAGVDDLGAIELDLNELANSGDCWRELKTYNDKIIENDHTLKARCGVFPEYIFKNGFIAPHLTTDINKHLNRSGYLLNHPFASSENKNGDVTQRIVDIRNERVENNTVEDTPSIIKQSNFPQSKISQ